MAEEKQKALIELLRGHKVYLQTHNFPDPDAISSAFGLKRYLEYYGITSTICYVGSIDRFNTRKMMDTFGIEIYSYDDIPDMQAEDYIVHVDCQKPNANTTDLLGNEVACVDHHPVFVKTEDYKFEDIRIVGACASIVASYFQTSGVPMDEDGMDVIQLEKDIQTYHPKFIYTIPTFQNRTCLWNQDGYGRFCAWNNRV